MTNEAEPLREIESWFRERNITLEYYEVGDDEIHEWVALMVPDGHERGVIEGGGGPTKLAAALDARERHEALDATTKARVSQVAVEVLIAASGEATASGPQTARIEVPSVVHEREIGSPDVTSFPPELDAGLKRAMEFGWFLGAVNEPNGSRRWVITDREQETVLATDVADTWEHAWDAALAALIEFLPPSGEK